MIRNVYVGLALWGAVVAAHAATDAAARERYERDRQDCLAGQTQQSREVCLREAGAAFQAARAGQLHNAPTRVEAANALARCQVFTGREEHAACVERVQNPSRVSGSVAGGGLLRESTVTIYPPAQ